MDFESKSFSSDQAISFGWNHTIQYFGFFLLYKIVTFIACGFFNLFCLTSTFVDLLSQKIYLRVIDTDKAYFEGDDLEASFPIFLSFYGASFLLFFLVLFGFILMIIPGIYWALKYQFVPILIVDKKCGIMDAFSQSAQLTSGNMLKLFGFNLMMVGIVILGALCFLVGLFIAIPTVGMANAHVYRQLLEQEQKV